MNALNQIANHLNISADDIKSYEQWATVWFVVIRGKGGRFVSKSVVKEEVNVRKFQVKQLHDTQTNKTVWGIVSQYGCYNVYKTKHKAEKVIETTPDSIIDFYCNSASGSIMLSYATGRYRLIDLTKSNNQN